MRAHRERGAIAVLAAVMIIVLVAFLGLVINVGLIVKARGQLQNASDSAALAAAGSLDGTTTGLAAARSMAYNYSRGHTVTGDPVTIDQGLDVRFGRWNFATRTFEEITDVSRVFEMTAVKVLNGRDGTGSHNLPLAVFFSGFFGRSTVNVLSQAVGIGRGARTDACPMPFVVTNCLPCNTPTRLVMSNDWSDNVGFLNLAGGHGNDAIAANILERCSNTALAQDYDAQNGNDLNTKLVQALLGLDKFDNLVSPITSGPNIGKSALCVFLRKGDAFPIMATADCTNPKFNRTVPVAQFATVEISAITDNGTQYTTCPTAAEWGSSGKDFGFPAPDNQRSLTMKLVCNGNGGVTYNNATTLRLVQ